MDLKILKAVKILTGIALIFLILYQGRVIVSILTPVLLALILTMLFLPLVDYLHKKLKSRLAATLIVLVPAFALIVFGLWWAASGLYSEAQGFVSNFPSVVDSLQDIYNDRVLPLVEGTRYEETFFVILDEVIVGGIQSLKSLALTLVSSGLSLIGSLPGVFVAVMVTIILVFYLIYEKKWLLKLVPAAGDSVDQVVRSIHGYIKTQFFVVSITAAICMLAFSLLGIPYVFIFGLLIAVFDILPILGAGTLLVPMTIWFFVVGQPFTAIMVALLYGLIVAVRQVVEPRLMAHNLGIHPIVAILSIYLGLKLFGPVGLVLLPLTASIAAGFPRFKWLKR